MNKGSIIGLLAAIGVVWMSQFYWHGVSIRRSNELNVEVVNLVVRSHRLGFIDGVNCGLVCKTPAQIDSCWKIDSLRFVNTLKKHHHGIE